MQRVNIANLLIEIVHNKSLGLEKYQPFLSNEEREPDIKVEVNGCKHIAKPLGDMVLDEKLKWIKNSNGNNISKGKEIKSESFYSSVYICKEEPEDIAYILNVNKQWNNASILYQQDFFNAESAITGPLAEILFRNRFLFNNGLVLHASAIQYEGKGILFSAPSETGKTTQANLWCKEMGASLINNDRPAVRIQPNGVYVYGTPWSGSISECNNSNASVSAIVMLEQAAENSICKLTTDDAILGLMPRCFLPYYDEFLMDIAIKNLDSLIQKVPIYLLKCKPDRGAVELVHKAIA